MKSMAWVFTAGMYLSTGIASAGTVCSSKEYPDHFEAMCIGDEKAPAVPAEAPAAKNPVQDVAAGKALTAAESSIPASSKSAAQTFLQRAAQQSLQKTQPLNPSSSESVRRFQSYLNNSPIQKGWSEKQAMRMRLIQQGQQVQE